MAALAATKSLVAQASVEVPTPSCEIEESAAVFVYVVNDCKPARLINGPLVYKPVSQFVI